MLLLPLSFPVNDAGGCGNDALVAVIVHYLHAAVIRSMKHLTFWSFNGHDATLAKQCQPIVSTIARSPESRMLQRTAKKCCMTLLPALCLAGMACNKPHVSFSSTNLTRVSDALRDVLPCSCSTLAIGLRPYNSCFPSSDMRTED